MKRKPKIAAIATTPARIRPPRKPIELRRTSMWGGVLQTSTRVEQIAAEWGGGQENKPKNPVYQRPIVWDPNDDLLLADSIDSGIPIGTLVLWCPDESRGDEWIIDGQQRVASILRMARGQTSICFDCDEDRYVVPETPDPIRYCPIDAMFDYKEYLERAKIIFDWGHDADDETNALSHDRLDRQQAAYARMRDSRVSLIIIRKNDESLVREIFRRINTTGKPMSEAEAFAGLARCKA